MIIIIIIIMIIIMKKHSDNFVIYKLGTKNIQYDLARADRHGEVNAPVKYN